MIRTRVLAQVGILAIWRNSGPPAEDPHSARSFVTVVSKAVMLPLRSPGQGWRREDTAAKCPAYLAERLPCSAHVSQECYHVWTHT